MRISDWSSDVCSSDLKVGGGTVLLQITEGRIGTISVENAKLYRPERIKRELPDVQPGTIYNAAVFRDGMRQLNSLPGLKARAILKPGAPYGSSDMMVDRKSTRLNSSH